MCELFGASLKENEDISGYLSEFFSHGVQHPYGWGIYREHHGDFEIVKEAVSSIKSALAKEIARTTEPQKHFMAHIRLATAGTGGRTFWTDRGRQHLHTSDQPDLRCF